MRVEGELASGILDERDEREWLQVRSVALGGKREAGPW